MKKILSLILVLCLFANIALADSAVADNGSNCNWATDIKPLPNGDFEYGLDCHLLVGSLVEDSKTNAQQVSDLNQAISLKDLALKDADTRATNWSNTSAQLESRIQTIDSEERHNEFLFFGLGVLSAVAVGFGMAKLVGR